MRLGFYLNPLDRLRDPGSNAEPEPAVIAALAALSGAQPILAGWSSEGGSLSERDLRLVRELVRDDLIIVTPQDSGLVDSVVKLRPDGVLLVASGWDGSRDFRPVQMEMDADAVGSVASEYKSAGVPTSLLAEPDAGSMKAIARSGLAGVVFDAEQYAGARTDEDAQSELDRLADAAMTARKYELNTAIGHGLTYQNIGPVGCLRYVEELYVGRSIVARAVLRGIDRAIGDMMNIIERYRALQ